MTILTDDERALLHRCHGQIGYAVAAPKDGVRYLAQSHASGGGRDFSYTTTNTSLQGEWRQFEVTARLPDGTPSRLRFDPPHLRAAIAMTRLQQWATSLPAELRTRALTAWAVRTRNLGELAAIVHEAIDMSAPVEQLELFPEPGSTESKG